MCTTIHLPIRAEAAFNIFFHLEVRILLGETFIREDYGLGLLYSFLSHLYYDCLQLGAAFIRGKLAFIAACGKYDIYYFA